MVSLQSHQLPEVANYVFSFEVNRRYNRDSNKPLYEEIVSELP